MVILGVCNANDSGAALIINGEIKSVANEERFTRKKLTRAFPVNSIEYVLKSQGLTVNDVDYIGCGAWGGIDPETTLDPDSPKKKHPERRSGRLQKLFVGTSN